MQNPMQEFLAQPRRIILPCNAQGFLDEWPATRLVAPQWLRVARVRCGATCSAWRPGDASTLSPSATPRGPRCWPPSLRAERGAATATVSACCVHCRSPAVCFTLCLLLAKRTRPLKTTQENDPRERQRACVKVEFFSLCVRCDSAVGDKRRSHPGGSKRSRHEAFGLVLI